MGELRVNGQLIEPGWIDQEFQSIKAEYERLGNVSCCERDDEFRGYARENIIAQVLISQEAERVIPEPTAEEVEKEFQAIADQNGGEINFLSLHGLSQDQKPMALAGLAKQLRTRKLTEQIQSPQPEFSEKEQQAFYNSQSELFLTEESVRAMHLFRSIRRAEEKLDSYNLLKEARTKLIAGEDFIPIAEQYSEKPVEEADLGFFKRGELMEEFEMVVFSMADGEVSPVFLSPHGMHVAKRVESAAPQLQPFEAVQDQVLTLLTQDWKEARLQEEIERLKEEAKVEEIETAESEEPAAW